MDRERSLSPAGGRIDFATLDLLPYGIIVVDARGDVLYYNAREEQIAGRSREAVIGKNFFTEIAPCAQAREFHGRFGELMREGGEVVDFEFVFPFPGRTREVEISLTRFENKGEPLCLISVRDVTEQKAAREHVMRSERLREAGEVAAGVAHNFSNILTVIQGNAELVLKKMAAEDPSRPRLEKIHKATLDGAELMKRIRDTTRQNPADAAAAPEVDLNAVVRDSVESTEEYARAAESPEGAGIAWELDLAEGLPPARASASELREAFVSLLRNAVDAVGGEGHISVRSRARDGKLVVEVGDDGAGMGAEVLGKLFTPLFTTKGKRGMGMGLATCYAIMRRHGGDITVETAAGMGATFTVLLPAAGG